MADASISLSQAHGLFELEGPKPLRESALWQLQSAFYREKAEAAWRDAIVPNFVTSNSFVASCYARIILAHIRDYFLRSPDVQAGQVIYIVEVGAGHGKLSFSIVRELLMMREQWPDPARPPFKFVITDFLPGMLQFWSEHECLKPLLRDGLIDLGVFDAEHDREIKLLHSGGKITSGGKCPIIAVANYTFDTLRQDAFRIVEGQLQEAMVRLLSESEGDAQLLAQVLAAGKQAADRPSSGGGHAGDIIRRMRCVWDYRPCTPEIYKNAHLQVMLRAYTSRLRNGSVLVPIGGITALSNLAAMGGGKLLMLAGDKAYNHEEELVGVRDPHVAVHGSFSFMTNFHAVRLYSLARGGFSLHTPFMEGFKCSAFLLDGASAAPLALADVLAAVDVTLPPLALASHRDLLYEWADCMDTFGPDNFSVLQRCVKDETPTPTLKLALAAIRMSAWDSDVFYKFKQILIDRTPHANEKQQVDIFRDVLEVAARYYPLQSSKDISFELGRICMGLKRYAASIQLFNASQRQCGEHHVTYYNCGISAWYLGDISAAHAAFSKSVALRPDYADAQSWKVRCEAKLAGDTFSATAAGGAEGSDAPPAAVPATTA